MKQHFDFIIVGQGLAGTLLAHDLEEKGNRLLLIDSNESASASRVAAGLPTCIQRLCAWRVACCV